MTRLAGPIRQLGIVVKDVDAAIQQWAQTVGAGPFIVFRELHFDTCYRYRGRSAPPPVVSIAIAHSGPLQVEIIQQHNGAPSAYLDFLNRGWEGLQHVSPWFASREEYDAAHQRLLADGLEVVHEGRPKGMDVRFAYFSRPGAGWPQLEISEALLPDIRPIGALLERLGSSWDGRSNTIDSAELPALLAATRV
jgi:Glyoxalase/Bleomycin resistance protein/Dioxygenase superfamily